jgi:hypothetical protein
MSEFETWCMSNAIIGEKFVLADLEAAWQAATQAERERCAKIADEQAAAEDGHDYAAENIAKRIREGGA